MANPPARVERVVDAVFDCSIRSCAQPTDGRMAETYILELDGDPARVVCKIGGPSVRTGDVIEPLVSRLVAATTDLPCPDLLASGTFEEHPDEERHWALYEFVDGDVPTPFGSLDERCRRRIVSETGEMLGALHAAHQFERTGGLGRDDAGLDIRSPAGLNLPERGRWLARRHPACDGSDWQPVLTHGDLFPGNLLVADDGAVTAFLDWGNAHVTTAGYALARAELRFVDWFRFPAGERGRLRDALRAGYRQHRPLPPDYRTLGSLYKLLWLGQSADRLLRHTRTARGRGQLRRHLRSLFT